MSRKRESRRRASRVFSESSGGRARAKKRRAAKLAVLLILLCLIVIGCYLWDRNTLIFSDFFYDFYYTYLSPQAYDGWRKILSALEAHFPPMSRRSYYPYRTEAIETLSSVLWGYTSRECAEVLDKLGL